MPSLMLQCRKLNLPGVAKLFCRSVSNSSYYTNNFESFGLSDNVLEALRAKSVGIIV